MSKKPARPTGVLKGTNVVRSITGMPELRDPFVFKFPTRKEDAEDLAMKGLITELSKRYVQYEFVNHSRHLKEDGPDFDVMWNGNVAHVELTEYAPLKGPYESAKRVFTAEEMARGLEERVLVKNSNYARRGIKPMFLLLYVTDDAFYVTEEVLLLLAYYLQFHADIIFEAIFFVAFWPDGRPHMRMPFPHREDLRLRDMSHISKQQVINLDVSDSELIASDVGEQTITVRQNLPPGADLRLLPDSLKAHIPGFEALITELQKKNNRV